MSRKWVVDASPLIVLGKAGHLHTLALLPDQLVIPQSVVAELNQGSPDDSARQWIHGDGRQYVAADCALNASTGEWNLGAGETAVIDWAISNPGFEAVLDDRRARHCAASHQVPIIGTVGAILLAKRRGLISAARPVLERLTKAGCYMDRRIMEAALQKVGESIDQ